MISAKSILDTYLRATEDLSDRRIHELHRDAMLHGDQATKRLCALALDGDGDARGQIAERLARQRQASLQAAATAQAIALLSSEDQFAPHPRSVGARIWAVIGAGWDAEARDARRQATIAVQRALPRGEVAEDVIAALLVDVDDHRLAPRTDAVRAALEAYRPIDSPAPMHFRSEGA